MRAETAADQNEGEIMMMKKLGATLMVALALGGAMASAALAAATTSDVQWFTGVSAPGSLLLGSESVKATGSGEFLTTVGETPLRLKSTELECKLCSIENSGSSAVGIGILVYKKVTVAAPSACAVQGGQIETAVMKLSADWMIGTSNYLLFQPQSGTNIAAVTLIAGTGSCPLSGKYLVSGTNFVRTNNATGVFSGIQGVTSSGSINSEAGGALKFGSAKAELNGSASFTLSGAEKGLAFATH